ncbi:MAG: uroporphyrinogen-III C-methyltransferase [Chloroflexota bacterium]|nr:uroporphyrinogen-III C-methyltransferase [Chloroflexota bacterium]
MSTREETGRENPSVGWIALVGAGPGDPELLTIRGRRYLEAADVVVYDRLVDQRLLGHAPKDAELIDVGKKPGGPRDRQEEINALLVERARSGKRVVRLKGGDPFIFGRGGEEVAALAKANIPFEIVPGITSAIGAPTYAGIPLTHRGVSSSLTIVTGSESPDKEGGLVDWDLLAKSGDTLSLLMGWENLPAISQALINGGREEDTPVAVVQWGTWSNQKTVVGPLADIAERARREGLSNPVVVVVGEVVNLRAASRWFDNRPLTGKRVLVTRSRTQSADLADLLERAGAEPVEVPTIEIQPVDDFCKVDAELARLTEYDWVVFTSTNAVEQLFGRLDALGRDARQLHGSRVAAIGTATASALSERGIVADLISRESVSQSLIDGLAEQGVAGQSILLPGAEIRPERLRRGLRDLGAEVREVTLYRTVAPSGAGERLAEALEPGVDVVTFTSSSTVTNLVALLDGDVTRLGGGRVACIGRVTAETARKAELNVDILAEDSTAAGLVDAIVGHYMPEGSRA